MTTTIKLGYISVFTAAKRKVVSDALLSEIRLWSKKKFGGTASPWPRAY